MGINPIEYKPWKKKRGDHKKRFLSISSNVFRTNLKSKAVLGIIIIGLLLTLVIPLLGAVLTPHEKLTKDMAVGVEEDREDDLETFGNFYINGDMNIEGSLSLQGMLTLDGNVFGTGMYTSANGITSETGLNVSGALDINGTAFLDGELTGTGTIYGFGFIEGKGNLSGDWSGEATVFDNITEDIQRIRDDREMDNPDSSPDQKDGQTTNPVDDDGTVPPGSPPPYPPPEYRMNLTGDLGTEGDLLVDGEISINGSFYVNGYLSLRGSVEGTIFFDNHNMLAQYGELTMAGSVMVDGEAGLMGMLQGEGIIIGTGFLNGTGNVSGSLSQEDITNIISMDCGDDDDDTSSEDSLFVEGSLTIEGDVLCAGDIGIDGSLYIDGVCVIMGNVTGSGSLEYKSTEMFHGEVYVMGAFDTNGTVVVDGSLNGAGMIMGTGNINGTGMVHGYFEPDEETYKEDEEIKTRLLEMESENEMSSYYSSQTSGFLRNELVVIFTLLLASIICADLISKDISNNSFVLYFSRSITTRDYISGKFIGAAVTLGLYTFIVPVVVALAIIGTQTGSDYSTSFVVLGLTVAGALITTVYFIPFGLMISSFTKRPSYAGVGIFMSFFVLIIISEIFRMFDKRWMLANPASILDFTYQLLFDRALPSQITGSMVAGILLTFLAIPLAILYINIHRKGVGR